MIPARVNGRSPGQLESINSVQIHSYGEALSTLYNLKKYSTAKMPTTPKSSTSTNVSMVKFLERGGLKISQLDTLNIIHVAGTKGKGSTCAFCESILRHAGLRTGFFSSPHLITVRERIRINGKAISKAKFTKYFYEVYTRLENDKEFENDMPGFFRFMTCLCYYTFFHEKVDVAIIEVGIGGTFDPTNVIRNPVVTGITSLAIEHAHLGNTIEEIATHKAGVMKQDVPCYTIDSHSAQCLAVLQQCALDVKCPLFIVKSIAADCKEEIQLGINNPRVSNTNAALAVELSNAFLAKLYPHKLTQEFPNAAPYKHGFPFPMSIFHKTGLEQCNWHGRFQVLPSDTNITYYLDGAHTKESLHEACNWFLRASPESSCRVLVFRLSGARKPETHIQPLLQKNDYFKLAIFSPLVVNFSGQSSSTSPDQWATCQLDDDEMSQCFSFADIWNNSGNQGGKGIVVESVNHVLSYLQTISEEHVSVLITGSLHAVGTYLSILDPELISVI